MGFFRKISSFFSPSGIRKAPDYSTWITVKCNRCGEVIRTRIDLRNDLSIEYADSPANITYYSHKVIIGNARCYQKIDVQLVFNSKRKLTQKSISGGEFVEDDPGGQPAQP